jgi:HSP20 family protein
MTNIAVRRDNGNKPSRTMEAQLEPYRMFRELANWDPFREMSPYMSQPAAGFIPSFEVKETKDSYLFKADLPGVQESDLDITLTGNRLTVTGKREAEKQEQDDIHVLRV